MTPIILAAGGGTRFGCPKALAKIGEETFLERLLDALETSPQLSKPLVVIGARAQEVITLHRKRSALWVENKAWQKTEMIDSLRLGAAQVEGAALLWTVDFPHGLREVLRYLLEQASDEAEGAGLQAWIPCAPDGARGQPLILSAGLMEDLKRERPEHLGERLSRGDVALHFIETPFPVISQNINTRAKLKAHYPE